MKYLLNFNNTVGKIHETFLIFFKFYIDYLFCYIETNITVKSKKLIIRYNIMYRFSNKKTI